MARYSVVVGNIGEVHTGNNLRAARKVFGEYRKMSKDNYGRAAGEEVTLFIDGEISLIYIGTLTED